MDFQFNIPLTGDLLNTSEDNYYVKQIYNAKEIPEKLKLCKQKLFSTDLFYIFDHFDIYYSVIQINGTDYNTMNNIMRAFDLLYITVDKLSSSLTNFLADSDSHYNDRIKYLNLTKMCLFLLVHIVRKFDASHLDLLKKQLPIQQKKRGRNMEQSEQFPDWQLKRSKFLVQLYNLMQLPLEKLWSPPIVEENFVNLLCDIGYRTLEILQMRSDNYHTVQTVFQIFGTAIKRYQHAINFPIKILQILRDIEHSGCSIAYGIKVLYDEYNITTFLSTLIKEIIDNVVTNPTDNIISKNYSNFLTELASTAPKLMIPYLSKLSDELLSCESYVLRNCLLQIMGDAILSELTAENLPEDMKNSRNEFLEYLLLHINDVSAFVRIKVLQIWHRLREEHAVPLKFQKRVLRGAIERLADKTSSVRKNAVQLIKTFLERNPFAANLTLEELKKKHLEEVEKMEKLTTLLTEQRKQYEEIEGKWVELIPNILPFIERIITNRQQNDSLLCDGQEKYEELIQRISKMLVEEKYEQAVELVVKADRAAGNSDLTLSLEHEEQCAYYLALLKSYLFLANGCKDANEELETQIKTIEFLKDSIEFSCAITEAMPKLTEMLSSKINSDVLEAVDLFTVGYMFRIKGTDNGMKQMLYLMWSSDKEKRDAVNNAYKKILFTTDQTGRSHAIQVVRNLSRFLQSCELGHYMALECLIEEWVKSEDIDAAIIQVLFERFTLKYPGTTENESCLALKILIMCSRAKSVIASANMNTIQTTGIGDRAKRNPFIFSDCLKFIINSVDNTLNTKYKRFHSSSNIVQSVANMYINFFMNPKILAFDDITMATVEFFYHMCQAPDVIAEKLIIKLLKQMKSRAIKRITDKQIEGSQQNNHAMEKTMPSQSTQRTTVSQQKEQQCRAQQSVMPVVLITRFVFMFGYTVLKELIFLDIDIYNNIKHRQELSEIEEKKRRKEELHHKTQTLIDLNMSTAGSSKHLSDASSDSQQELNEDLIGAIAEDNAAELINHICEDVLMYNDRALSAKLYPYIFEICKYPVKYKDQRLQLAATTALIRFMCVSSKICHANMPFLMNILNYSKNEKIKCNIVIGLSDLTFRFPNIVEPWTGLFYTTLHEKDTEVRLTAVKMISHLILHEMIRVKAQIADLAICIVDDNDEIRNITKQFFKEIASKANMLYNVLPDIISKLSDTSMNLEEEKYRIIMRYILSLIQKDRQVESLVEKLCLRFTMARVERQWRDIAYCLSLLSYNERAIKKLIDNIQHYKDVLNNDEVYQLFKFIINNTLKTAKGDFKETVNELESRIEECLKTNDDSNLIIDGEISHNATRRKTQPKRNNKKGPRKKRKPNNKNHTSVDSNIENSTSSESGTRKRKNANKKNTNRGRPKNKVDDTSNQTPVLSKRRSKRLTNATRTKLIDSSCSSEDSIILPKLKKPRKHT